MSLGGFLGGGGFFFSQNLLQTPVRWFCVNIRHAPVFRFKIQFHFFFPVPFFCGFLVPGWFCDRVDGPRLAEKYRGDGVFSQETICILTIDCVRCVSLFFVLFCFFSVFVRVRLVSHGSRNIRLYGQLPRRRQDSRRSSELTGAPGELSFPAPLPCISFSVPLSASSPSPSSRVASFGAFSLCGPSFAATRFP